MTQIFLLYLLLTNQFPAIAYIFLFLLLIFIRVYLLTPIFNIPQVADWQNYFKLYTNLSEERQEIGERVGLKWSYLQSRNLGGNGRSNFKNSEENTFVERVTQRFYVALVLSELIHEVPIWTVSKKYFFIIQSLKLILNFLDIHSHEET